MRDQWTGSSLSTRVARPNEAGREQLVAALDRPPRARTRMRRRDKQYWRSTKHIIQNMDIDDLREYLLDMDY